MVTWTNIAKPSTLNWTNTETFLPVYDESSITYDTTTTFYDGVNQAQWTNIAKPSGTAWTNIAKPS
jgi:hypothetical protein